MSINLERFALRVLREAAEEIRLEDLEEERRRNANLQAALDRHEYKEREFNRLVARIMTADGGNSDIRRALDLIDIAVEREAGIPIADIRGRRRHPNIVQARHLAMWLARQLTPLSLPQIGRHWDGRDHTTVLHAVRTVAELEGKAAQQRDKLFHRLRIEVGEIGLAVH